MYASARMSEIRQRLGQSGSVYKGRPSLVFLSVTYIKFL